MSQSDVADNRRPRSSLMASVHKSRQRIPRSHSLTVLHEMATLDELTHVILDRSALLRQLVNAQGKLGKLCQDFLLPFDTGLSSQRQRLPR